MKALHRPDLFTWSGFDPERNVDFNGTAWRSPDGLVLIDPMPMSTHDLDHLVSLGPTRLIVMTNSDHVRAAPALARILGAELAGPAAEREGFPVPCARWIEDGEELLPGLVALALEGSKTPGELALWLRQDTLITGDLVRAHRAGALMALPDAKLKDRAAARRSVERLAALPGLQTVLVGDGWPLFGGAAAELERLAAALA